jgi:hypothetical protein
LKAVPDLPPGWTVDWDNDWGFGYFDFNYPNNDGSAPAALVTAQPIWVPASGKFLYGTGLLGAESLEATIKLNFNMYVPGGETGDKELNITWQWAGPDGIDQDLPCSDNPQPIVDLNVVPNDADYQQPDGTPGADWVIDADEAGRILIYLRAGSYDQVPVSPSYPDGYAPGAE